MAPVLVLQQLLLLLVAAVPRVCAECWLRSDGHEICSPDPMAWRIAWWLWFAALILIFVYAGFWRQCCFARFCCNRQDATTTCAGDDAAQLSEPLLEQPFGKNSTPDKPKKAPPPVYRYLDP